MLTCRDTREREKAGKGRENFLTVVKIPDFYFLDEGFLCLWESGMEGQPGEGGGQTDREGPFRSDWDWAEASS
jgi:hypothetical protein